MDVYKPVQLPQKIDYLNQKIFLLHSQVRKSDDIELRLNFQQFIDTCIREIITIKDQSSPQKAKTQQPANKEKYSSFENEKLEFQKKLVSYQMKQLENRQMQMQYQTIKLKLYNKQKQNERLQYEKAQIRLQNAQQLKRLAEKNKFLEQQIQKLVKLNKAQQEEIRNVKQERNRAEERQLELQQKYDDDIGKLEKFADKKPRYIDRTTEGLKCTHYYTNTGGTNAKSNKIILLKLPTILQVNKLVYGVMLGVQVNSKQILYYDKVQLFEKELTQIELEGQSLVLTYRRRKQNVRIVLDQYVVRTNQVVVMLYGKGDSVIVHDDVKSGATSAR